MTLTHPLGTQKGHPNRIQRGAPPWATPYVPLIIFNPFFSYRFLQFSSKNRPFQNLIAPLWIQPLLPFLHIDMALPLPLGIQKGILIESSGGSPQGHPICIESIDVEPCLKLQIFYNVLLKKGLSQNMVEPSGIQPLLQFLRLLMTLAHLLGIQWGIPIESGGGSLLATHMYRV